MAEDRLDIDKWTCVRSSDNSWIHCHIKDRPTEGVTISDDRTVKLVDPIDCKKEVTGTGRIHWTCSFEPKEIRENKMLLARGNIMDALKIKSMSKEEITNLIDDKHIAEKALIELAQEGEIFERERGKWEAI